MRTSVALLTLIAAISLVPAGSLISTRGRPAGEETVLVSGLPPTDTPEETLHYDGPNDDALGLTHGGAFYGAVRFTPVLPCSLKAILFYHADASHDAAVYVYGPATDTTPGPILDSAPYTSPAENSWVRVDLGRPVVLDADVDFWTSVRVVHDSDFFPLGVDSGPMVVNRGGFFSINGNTWLQLNRIGSNTNVNVRAIIAPIIYTHDIGVRRINTPWGLVPTGSDTPSATIKNFGQAIERFDIQMDINPGGYTSRVTIPELGPGETAAVSFHPWTAPDGGFYTVYCSYQGHDQNPGNDTASALALVPNFTETFEANDGGFTVDNYPEPGWVWGAPGTPRPSPHSGTKVWGAPLSGEYVDDADWNLFSRVYLASVDSPAIAFYHWYTSEAGVDGGNVSYSLDTGRTWNNLVPWTDYAAGYDGFVYALNNNGYSGTSATGWTLGLFRIPVTAATPFQMHWRFASDASNTAPGWIVDDVSGVGISPPTAISESRKPEERPASCALSVCPNPATGSARVSFSLSRSEAADLSLYDASGRFVRTLVHGVSPSGPSSFILNPSSLSKGVYWLRLKAESAETMTKLVIE